MTQGKKMGTVITKSSKENNNTRVSGIDSSDQHDPLRSGTCSMRVDSTVTSKNVQNYKMYHLA